MTLLGVFHGIGDEVGKHLLQASLVQDGRTAIVGTVFFKWQASLLDTLGKCLTDVIEDAWQVNGFRFDGHGLSHAGGFQNVVDESQQHVAVVADDAQELLALLGSINHLQQSAEADNGVQGRADFVGHVGQESALQLAGVFGTCRLLAQPLLNLHQIADVAHDAEVFVDSAVGILQRYAADAEPRQGDVGQLLPELVDGSERLALQYSFLKDCLSFLSTFLREGVQILL